MIIKKFRNLLIFTLVLSCFVQKTYAIDEIEEDPYKVTINFSNNIKKEYVYPEAAKNRAVQDFNLAITYIEQKLNTDTLDFTNENVISCIFGSVLDENISNELRDDLFGLAEFVDIYNKPLSIEPTAIIPNDPGPGGSGTYDASKAVLYALKYALNYNTSYTSYANSGGDCANFMSQALYSAGKIQNSKWKTYTTTWIRADSFVKYYDGNNEYNVGWNGSRGNSPGVILGDIIAFDYGNNGTYDHVVMVTTKGTTSTYGTVLYYSGHTNDTKNANFNQIFTNNADNQNAYIKSFRVK